MVITNEENRVIKEKKLEGDKEKIINNTSDQGKWPPENDSPNISNLCSSSQSTQNRMLYITHNSFQGVEVVFSQSLEHK